MLKLGIIGYPLGHTLSPVMHKAALDYMKIDGAYSVLETPTEFLQNKIEWVKDNGYKGFNVTIPYKVDITQFLTTIDEHARIIGAVNAVLVNDDKTLSGFNTDVYGFTYAIPETIRKNLENQKAVILGAGGAARAVAAGLADIRIKEITIVVRNVDKAEDLEQLIQKNYKGVTVNITEFNDKADYSDASIIVNTTPLGMQGKNEGMSPISDFTINSLDKQAIAYDLVYKPRKTKFLQQATSRDLIIIDGAEMLVLQGAKALSIWTNNNVPVDIMRETVLKSLSNE